MAIIELENVSISRHDKEILHHVNFKVDEGELVYVIGKVGTGKSTLLKALYAELPVSEGRVEVLGRDLTKIKQKHVPALRHELGIVFQDFQLFREHNVMENLDFVLRATGWKKKKERMARIGEVLTAVDLLEKANRFPHELSGGEQQRIAIARALLNRPKLILADEPTGNLDLDSSLNILNILHNATEQGTAVVIITHNLHLMQHHPGIVYRCEDDTLTEITYEVNQPIDFGQMEEDN